MDLNIEKIKKLLKEIEKELDKEEENKDEQVFFKEDYIRREEV